MYHAARARQDDRRAWGDPPRAVRQMLASLSSSCSAPLGRTSPTSPILSHPSASGPASPCAHTHVHADPAPLPSPVTRQGMQVRRPSVICASGGESCQLAGAAMPGQRGVLCWPASTVPGSPCAATCALAVARQAPPRTCCPGCAWYPENSSGPRMQMCPRTGGRWRSGWQPRWGMASRRHCTPGKVT